MTVETLNGYIRDGYSDDVVRVMEARQVKALSKIADDICQHEGVKLIALAGGSSSGKTTTSMRLRTQLLVNGKHAIHLSTDDYFVGDQFNPRDENGELDYEHVDCVDAKGLLMDIKTLMRGAVLKRRKFDFLNHKPMWSDDIMALLPGGYVVLEGIHAFNPKIIGDFPRSSVYRIFIDPAPSFDLLDDRVITSADARFLRRLVRDNSFRKLDAESTLGLWPKVMAGERRWIDPYRMEADVEFNSYLDYETSVLKYYAGGILELARKKIGNHPQVMDSLDLIRRFDVIPPVKVPGDSILRETIGGSQLDY